ncbi:unnamed protein product, partial [marine sediment metagenome]
QNSPLEQDMKARHAAATADREAGAQLSRAMGAA